MLTIGESICTVSQGNLSFIADSQFGHISLLLPIRLWSFLFTRTNDGLSMWASKNYIHVPWPQIITNVPVGQFWLRPNESGFQNKNPKIKFGASVFCPTCLLFRDSRTFISRLGEFAYKSSWIPFNDVFLSRCFGFHGFDDFPSPAPASSCFVSADPLVGLLFTFSEKNWDFLIHCTLPLST